MAVVQGAMKRLEGLPIQDDSLRDDYSSLVTLRDTLSQNPDDLFNFVGAYIKVREALTLAWYQEWLSLLEDSYRLLNALEFFMASIDELITDIDDEASNLEVSLSKQLIDECAANVDTEFEIFEDLIHQSKIRLFENLSNEEITFTELASINDQEITDLKQ